MNSRTISLITVLLFWGTHLRADEQYKPKRCELIPLPNHQVSFQIDGEQRLRWHYDNKYPRPFFYPLSGPTGTSLTRMGHPGAENHDHHRSVWFANHDVDGFTFWADGKGTQIRQKHWYAYEDGDQECIMGCVLGWYDSDGNERMTQDVVAALIPGNRGEYELELQTEFKPASPQSTVVLGKTNFGFLAVRVAKSISEHFGGGKLTDSEGNVGEPNIFGKQAKWMDYSGPVASGNDGHRDVVIEGITYHDHPENPRYPTHWHVRSDGWMGASFGMQEGLELTAKKPLRLRYLLEVHSGAIDSGRANTTHARFGQRHGFVIQRSTRPHRQYEVVRLTKLASNETPESAAQ